MSWYAYAAMFSSPQSLISHLGTFGHMDNSSFLLQVAVFGPPSMMVYIRLHGTVLVTSKTLHIGWHSVGLGQRVRPGSVGGSKEKGVCSPSLVRKS